MVRNTEKTAKTAMEYFWTKVLSGQFFQMNIEFDSMLCNCIGHYGDSDEEVRDTCHGDSGGPLAIQRAIGKKHALKNRTSSC